MESGDIVKCVIGHEDLLEEECYYTIKEVTKSNNYKLEEVNPPHPYDCWDKNRFEPTGQNIYDELSSTIIELQYELK